MEAKSVCDKLLSSIKSSGLNFVLTETPFTVNIVLKKTFIKTKESDPQASNSRPSNSKVRHNPGSNSLAEDLHSMTKHSNTFPVIKTMSSTLDPSSLDYTNLDSSTWNPTTFTQLKIANDTCRLKDNTSTKGIKTRPKPSTPPA